MPSKLVLRGASEAIWLIAAPDQIIEAISRAREGIEVIPGLVRPPDAFLRLEMVPAGPDEPSRPVYIDPTQVAAVAPLDDREIQAEYADLPDWLER